MEKVILIEWTMFQPNLSTLTTYKVSRGDYFEWRFILDPTQLDKCLIMVASDQTDSAPKSSKQLHELIKGFIHITHGDPHHKISEVVDKIIVGYGFIPSINEGLIHFLNATKWSLSLFDDIIMVKMGQVSDVTNISLDIRLFL